MRTEYSATTTPATLTSIIDYSYTELFVFLTEPWDPPYQNTGGVLDLFQADVDLTVTDMIWDITTLVSSHTLTSRESTHANREGNIDFTITIKDVCWDLAVEDPEISSAYLAANIGATTDLTHTIMDLYDFEFTNLNMLPADWAKEYCGAWTHTIEYVSGVFNLDPEDGSDYYDGDGVLGSWDFT